MSVYLVFSLTAPDNGSGSTKLLNNGVSLRTFVTNTPACSCTSFPASSHAKLVCEPDCIEYFLADRCDKATSLGTTNEAGSNLLENVKGVQSCYHRSGKTSRPTRTSRSSDGKEASKARLSKKMKSRCSKDGKCNEVLNTHIVPQKNCNFQHCDQSSCISGDSVIVRLLKRKSKLPKKLQESPNLKTLKRQNISTLKLEKSPKQSWVLSQLVFITDSKLRPRKLSGDFTPVDSHCTKSPTPNTDTSIKGVNKADVIKGTLVIFAVTVTVAEWFCLMAILFLLACCSLLSVGLTYIYIASSMMYLFIYI